MFAYLSVQRLRGSTGELAVDLSNKRLGPESAQIISSLLRKNRTLKSLCLQGNCIGNRGAHAIADALKFNPTLTALDVRNNGWIHEKTLALLAKVVHHLDSL